MLENADTRAALLARAGKLRLPASFVLGAATSAYQIEGAIDADGKGESIWDRFVRRPGVIIDGTTGDVACDHYHRWAEDIGLLKAMGLDAYRFSLAWTRIQPDGMGAANSAGIAFYDRLIDALLEAGIAPHVTLYHWDLPQALQDRGGWYNRETSHRLADYAEIAAKAFGDRVKNWVTINEPWTFCWSGHADGEDAPGLADGVKGGVAASHHALLGHGLSVPRIRAAVPDAKVGVVFDLNCVEPASDSAEDRAAATRFEGAQNRWFLDAVFKGGYPADMLALYGDLLPVIEADDAATIAAPVDFLGVNIYRRSVMKAGSTLPPLNFERVSPPGQYTATNYEIWPRCIYDILHYVHRNYGPKAIWITENGMALDNEAVGADGAVDDPVRAAYYIDHLAELERARAEGVPVKGYFAWTLSDNFEWAYGYRAAFGITHVDFATQERRIKLSGHVLAEIQRAKAG